MHHHKILLLNPGHYKTVKQHDFQNQVSKYGTYLLEIEMFLDVSLSLDHTMKMFLG